MTALAVYLKHDLEKYDCYTVSMIPLNSTDSIWVGTDLNNVYGGLKGHVTIHFMDHLTLSVQDFRGSHNYTCYHAALFTLNYVT